jgi:hypothetical protein
MSRALLALALVLSLAPPLGVATVVVASVGGGSGTPEQHRHAGRPKPAPIQRFLPLTPSGQCTSLQHLFGRASRLDRQLARIELVPGRPLPHLRARARQIDAALARWRRHNQDAWRPLAEVARALHAQLGATVELSRGPTAARLGGFNRAVARVNVARSRLIDYC